MLRAAHGAALHRILDLPAGPEQVKLVAAWLAQGGVPLYTHAARLYPLERVRGRLSGAGPAGAPGYLRAAERAHLQAVEALLEDAIHQTMAAAAAGIERGTSACGHVVLRALCSGITFAPEGPRSLGAYDAAARAAESWDVIEDLEYGAPGTMRWPDRGAPTPNDRFDDVQRLVDTGNTDPIL